MAEIENIVDPVAAADVVLADQEAAVARTTSAMHRHLDKLAPQLRTRLEEAGVCEESAGLTP